MGYGKFKDAKNIMVARSEYEYAQKHPYIRFKKKWWDGMDFTSLIFRDTLLD
ncbi:Protein of unknown function [Lactobacillus hominis DSM 23910 = CRBIP 24.179]|uniref:Uncharacterized protein n=1 Tax=Lactobacillus hominis DSM 23910 = CRBIP 24.179 TaxID=1423758 RepID=I7L686_9LACO|nr:Protein of unknown function [Lactobacillus hominis DSM 23910 = CRBIP 24.179]